MKIKTQLNKSAVLEVGVQISSIAVSFYLIDLRGYPFLENSFNTNSNIFYN